MHKTIFVVYTYTILLCCLTIMHISKYGHVKFFRTVWEDKNVARLNERNKHEETYLRLKRLLSHVIFSYSVVNECSSRVHLRNVLHRIIVLGSNGDYGA